MTTPHVRTLITTTESEVFRRRGFNETALIGKGAGVGFTASIIYCHGSHPQKLVIGPMRCYVVLSGTGTFVVDGVSYPVAPENHITIKPGQTYSYRGQLKLFVYNVSPESDFRDTTVALPSEADESNTDLKTIRLPNRQLMMERLVAVMDDPHVVHELYPLFLEYAGERKNGMGVYNIVMEALSRHTRDLPAETRKIIYSNIRGMVAALVDDDEVKAYTYWVFDKDNATRGEILL